MFREVAAASDRPVEPTEGHAGLHGGSCLRPWLQARVVASLGIPSVQDPDTPSLEPELLQVESTSVIKVVLPGIMT